MNSIFPNRATQPQIFRTADIAEILRARWQQQQAEKLEKPEPVSKLWQDHFRSVADFNSHLVRIGGLENYTSLMEKIRRLWGEPTIKIRLSISGGSHGKA